MDDLEALEDRLFAEWKARREGVVRDGAVDPGRYVQSDPRVLLVLKEVNDNDGGGWDLRHFLQRGGRGQTWNTVARWMKGMAALDQDLPWDEVSEVDAGTRRRQLRRLCVMNLKKTPGGASSDANEIRRAAEMNSDLLNRQFRLYDPDIVICGGTNEIFSDVIDAIDRDKQAQTRRSIWYNEFAPGKHLIAFYHPQARIRASFLYYGLIDAARELKGSRPQR
jgi:hypothetical protein